MKKLSSIYLTFRSALKKAGFWFILGAILIGLDYVLKYFFSKFWPEDIFLNYYLGFGVKANFEVIAGIYVFAAVIIAAYLFVNWKTSGNFEKIAYVLVVSGGSANFIERFVFEYVTDYIHVLNGVFNLADFYIIVGVLLLIKIQFFFKKSLS